MNTLEKNYSQLTQEEINSLTRHQLYFFRFFEEKAINHQMMTVKVMNQERASLYGNTAEVSTHDVIEFIKSLTDEAMARPVRDQLVEIDFHNANVVDFLNYVGSFMVSEF